MKVFLISSYIYQKYVCKYIGTLKNEEAYYSAFAIIQLLNIEIRVLNNDYILYDLKILGIIDTDIISTAKRNLC